MLPNHSATRSQIPLNHSTTEPNKTGAAAQVQDKLKGKEGIQDRLLLILDYWTIGLLDYWTIDANQGLNGHPLALTYDRSDFTVNMNE